MSEAQGQPALPAINPFCPGWGARPLYLAGRLDEQRAFLAALNHHIPTRNILITGESGIGKTVLLAQFRKHATQHHWLWTGSDWGEEPVVSEKDVATRLIVDLARVLAPVVGNRRRALPVDSAAAATVPDQPATLADLWRIYNAESGSGSDKLKAMLKRVAEIISAAGLRGIVFAFDEAQNLGDKKDVKQFPLSLICEVFAWFQRRNSPCQFRLVMAGQPPLATHLADARTNRERIFHNLTVKRLVEAEIRDAIQKPLELIRSPLTFSEPAIACVVAESKGYPFLVHYICRETYDAWTGCMSAGAIADVPMTAIAAKLDLDFFIPRWNRATKRQQTFMQVIATLPGADGEFLLQDITAASESLLERPFTPSHAIQILGHLSAKGLIHRNRHGAYCFAVPMLASFIRRSVRDASAGSDGSGGP